MMRLRADFPSRLGRTRGQSHGCYTQAPRPPGRGPRAGQADVGRCSQGPCLIKAWLQLAPSSPRSLALCVKAFPKTSTNFRTSVLLPPRLPPPRLDTPCPPSIMLTVYSATPHHSEPDCPSWEAQAIGPHPPLPRVQGWSSTMPSSAVSFLGLCCMEILPNSEGPK